MWKSATLKGLDEALAELQRAIESLPDTSVKKKLLDRYQRLKSVREDLEAQPRNTADHYWVFGVALFAVMLVVVTLYLTISRKS